MNLNCNLAIAGGKGTLADGTGADEGRDGAPGHDGGKEACAGQSEGGGGALSMSYYFYIVWSYIITLYSRVKGRFL